jgi:outer membrane receptor protein involved in Fe transport
VDNVFDQEYYERADPISYPDPGRSVGVALRWSEIR